MKAPFDKQRALIGTWTICEQLHGHDNMLESRDYATKIDSRFATRKRADIQENLSKGSSRPRADIIGTNCDEDGGLT
ncbi:hypothetical protein EGT07_02235 [Herbaspirillum sp. HC18]|nr:hypothetical protein EGT07_02235 [Herbaspirillum sp. HC18]